MSQENKNAVLKFFGWVWTEIKQGNAFVVALILAATYFGWTLFGKPMYDSLKGRSDVTYKRVLEMQDTIERLQIQLEKRKAQEKKDTSTQDIQRTRPGIKIDTEY